MSWFHGRKHGPSQADIIGMRARGIPETGEGYQQYKNALWAEGHPGISSVNNILANGGKGTWLDANGDPAENAAFANAWGRMGHNRELAAVNSASVDSPNDPYATGFARTKARIASGSDMANAFANRQLQTSANRSQALTSLLGMQYGADQQGLDRNAQMQAARRQQMASLWGSLGQLGGAAIGAAA